MRRNPAQDVRHVRTRASRSRAQLFADQSLAGMEPLDSASRALPSFYALRTSNYRPDENPLLTVSLRKPTGQFRPRPHCAHLGRSGSAANSAKADVRRGRRYCRNRLISAEAPEWRASDLFGAQYATVQNKLRSPKPCNLTRSSAIRRSRNR